MKLPMLFIGACLIISTPAMAEWVIPPEASVDYQREAWAVQSAITTGGNISAGLNRYTPLYSAGINVGANISNKNNRSQVTLGIFGGPRVLILPQTYFAFGLDLVGAFGDDNNAYFIGPYVSVEYYLSTHLLLSAFINPISYSSNDVNGSSSESTVHILSTGGIGFSYLF